LYHSQKSTIQITRIVNNTVCFQYESKPRDFIL